MSYTHFEHRHNFAAWAAARATQRAFASVEDLKEAIEISELPTLLTDTRQWPSTTEQVDALHRRLCRQLIEALSRQGVTGATYGRGAKLIAVYLKSMVVLGEHSDTPFARLLHPPVDRILLQNMSRDPSLDERYRRLWRNTSWTSLEEPQYFELIASFRECGLDRPAFWMIERYWDVTAN